MPRLLPATMAVIGALLAMKSIALVRAAVPAEKVAVAAPAHPAAAPPAPPAPAHAAAPPLAPAQQPPPPPPNDAAPIPDAERAVLLELRQRRQDLDKREAALAARESVLAAAEQKLSARVDELTALQKRLESLEAARKQQEEAGWQGLVKVYETMKPRDAAVIFNDLQMSVLLGVLDRMKEAKAAPILAAMNAEKAREVTAELAHLRARRTTEAGSTQPTRSGG
ncbi:MAG: hypothetical protein JO227_06550 [Acetobacteraceae bacterium]|nr:hypothetical protein [Acetobacteraceae bacterium]